MKVRLEGGLLFVTASLTFRGQTLALNRVILDTGSIGSVFAVDSVSAIGLIPEPEDNLRQLRGIGGTETVFLKVVDKVMLDEELSANSFTIEIGAMGYGLDIEGIIGTDFLLQTEAILDMEQLEIYKKA